MLLEKTLKEYVDIYIASTIKTFCSKYWNGIILVGGKSIDYISEYSIINNKSFNFDIHFNISPSWL